MGDDVLERPEGSCKRVVAKCGARDLEPALHIRTISRSDWHSHGQTQRVRRPDKSHRVLWLCITDRLHASRLERRGHRETRYLCAGELERLAPMGARSRPCPVLPPRVQA
jgi:hypothetical protein